MINLSLGGGGASSKTFKNAINATVNAGTVVVVGNDNTNAAGIQPANYANVITVGATDRTGNRAAYKGIPYSHYGTTVEISAPGGDMTNPNNGIYSTLNTGTTVPGVIRMAISKEPVWPHRMSPGSSR